MVEYIKYDEKIMGIIIRAQYENDGVNFFTPHDFSQQLAYMKRKKGEEVEPHIHNVVERNVMYTQEVLYIKRGKMRVDFYNTNQEFLESRILSSGDVILLASGGHGMEILEEVEMFEIKQGPYLGENDKIRFKRNGAEEKNG